MELTEQEKKFMINALDAVVRQAGMQAAPMALGITAKIQESMKEEENG